MSQGRICKHIQVRDSLSCHLVSSNLPSHFAVIHQSTHLGGQDNFAVIMIALTSFKNDYIGWWAHFRSTRGICLKRLVEWGFFYWKCPSRAGECICRCCSICNFHKLVTFYHSNFRCKIFNMLTNMRALIFFKGQTLTWDTGNANCWKAIADSSLALLINSHQLLGEAFAWCYRCI